MKDYQIERMPNPVIIYDAFWKVCQINNPALSLLGYSELDELFGKSIQQITVGSVPPYAASGQEMEHLGKDGKGITFFAQFQRVDDHEVSGGFYYLESGFPYNDVLQTAVGEQKKQLDYWSLLAENVPGLMVILLDEHFDIQCSIGQKGAKFFVPTPGCDLKNLNSQLPREFKDVLQPLFKIAREGTTVSRELAYKDDFYAISLDPLSDGDGQFLCVVVVQNITETKLVEKKLMFSKEEAEEANEAKSNFVAKMSHEIRTPLNAIIGFSDQLKRTRLTNKQSDYLDIVNNSSQHLLSIVEDILVLAKVEAGQIHVDAEPFKVDVVLKSIHDILGHRILKKNLTFKIQSDIPHEEVFLGDPAKLRQILINLVSNAIKFTPYGKIVLSCSTMRNTSTNRTIRFDISDSGIGIAQEKLDVIFEPFHQIDNSLSRSYFGSGLGLTICKELVGSLGGHMSATSTIKKGSTFSFTLFFEKTTKPYVQHEKYNTPVHNNLLKSINILYVDDDPINRMLGKIILNKYKAKVVFAKTGQEAISLYKPGRFHIVLLDINLPGLNGIEVAKRFREMEGHSKNSSPAKIIAMTANALQRHIKIYIQSGMDDFLLKPFTEENLCQKIALHVSDRMEEGFSEQFMEAHQSGGEGDVLEGLMKFTKGDKDFALLMLKTFVESGIDMLNKIKTDFARNDYPSVAESVHRLLPSMEQLGFVNTNKLLKNIERKYLRKESFVKDPALIEMAISEIKSCVESVKETMDEMK